MAVRVKAGLKYKYEADTGQRNLLSQQPPCPELISISVFLITKQFFMTCFLTFTNKLNTVFEFAVGVPLGRQHSTEYFGHLVTLSRKLVLRF